jgi:hypothetical protein
MCARRAADQLTALWPFEHHTEQLCVNCCRLSALQRQKDIRRCSAGATGVVDISCILSRQCTLWLRILAGVVVLNTEQWQQVPGVQCSRKLQVPQPHRSHFADPLEVRYWWNIPCVTWFIASCSSNWSFGHPAALSTSQCVGHTTSRCRLPGLQLSKDV